MELLINSNLLKSASPPRISRSFSRVDPELYDSVEILHIVIDSTVSTEIGSALGGTDAAPPKRGLATPGQLEALEAPARRRLARRENLALRARSPCLGRWFRQRAVAGVLDPPWFSRLPRGGDCRGDAGGLRGAHAAGRFGGAPFPPKALARPGDGVDGVDW